MEYRTEEQFKDIVENAINGNWTDAFVLAEKAGFYAQDLIRHHENTEGMYGSNMEDIVYIAEGAQKRR